MVRQQHATDGSAAHSVLRWVWGSLVGTSGVEETRVDPGECSDCPWKFTGSSSRGSRVTLLYLIPQTESLEADGVPRGESELGQLP